MTIAWGIINIVLIFIFVIHLYFKYKFSYWKSKSIPYLEPKIPFGNLLFDTHIIFFSNDAYKLGRGNNPFVGGYIFSQPVAIPTDLDLIKNIMKKDFEYFSDRGLYHNERDDPLSANLLTLEGDKWKNLRAKLTPTFTSGKMKFMFPIIVKIGNEFRQVIENILQLEGSCDIEMKDLISRFTTDVIGTCAFGIECNSLKDPNSIFLKMGKKAFVSGTTTTLKRIFETQFGDLSKLLHLKWFTTDVSEFFMNIVQETVEYREKQNVRRDDFMDLLIELKNGKFEDGKVGKLTMYEIAAQALLFYLGGYETSATTMSYAIYELSLNQEVQMKTRKEIVTVLNKYNGDFTYEAAMDMLYIDQIISETLRKYPPIPALFRRTIKNYQVPSTNNVIEKGITVLIPAYAIQHDPEIYPNPEDFDPDRFTTENIKLRHASTFLGFGDGLRNCIGSRFGRMQVRVGLITLLQNFKFEKCNKTEIPMKFHPKSPMLSAKNGVWVKVSKI